MKKLLSNRSSIVTGLIGILVLSVTLSPSAQADPLNDCVDGWLDYWEELFGETSTPDDVGIAKGKCCKNQPALCSSPGSSDPGFALTIPELVGARERMVLVKQRRISAKRAAAEAAQAAFESSR